ncbi:MAG: AzlC family ABC transporter permease [Lachnospiraceae bacterium]|nr:AzlC family ABC transporter permease [Lachnospiraceae bacterium]
MEKKRFTDFKEGMLSGIPIMLGYFSVSFGVGILAHQAGMSVFSAALLSATNLTSAGEVAGIDIIASHGSYIEMAITQFVINFRYVLMGLSLTQRTDKNFNLPHRMIASFGITDEIFALLIGHNRKISPWFTYGVIILPLIGWTSGTALGAAVGSILPESITNALGILLYGMFVAIIIPPAKKDRRIILAVVLAAIFSSCFKFLMPFVTGGFAVIISSVLAAVLLAIFFPISEKEIEEEGR